MRSNRKEEQFELYWIESYRTADIFNHISDRIVLKEGELVTVSEGVLYLLYFSSLQPVNKITRV